MQSECCKGREGFSESITTTERAKSLEMFGKEIVGKERKFLVVVIMSISFGELSQKVTYLFCDELDIVSKELRSRVRQATKDVVKSEV